MFVYSNIQEAVINLDHVIYFIKVDMDEEEDGYDEMPYKIYFSFNFYNDITQRQQDAEFKYPTKAARDEAFTFILTGIKKNLDIWQLEI